VTTLKKVLVANRGEIAVRVARTCAELGITSVAVHSDPDEHALHVRVADEAIRLPGSAPGDTYLDAERIVAAARDCGADAVHPGYGFLSENAHFARLVEEAGLTWVGPSAAAIAALGNKVSARALAVAAGVPVVPGLDTGELDAARLRSFGDEHGWPVVVKASLGGGGRGMRVVAGPDEADAALASARAEARTAFGDDHIFAERYLRRPRHIEVQILADAHGTVQCWGERDCSVQRRHQKLVEEAPAPGLPDILRGELADAATRLARQVGYRGAGTVEFLVEDERFHFLEMNTRIQVEHPVTEAVFGVDIVREQLMIAGGAALPPPPADREPRGHAIECRINAEDPTQDYLPVPGPLPRMHFPWLPGVRVDTGYEPGDEIPPHYDSLIAKLIVWGPDRATALHRLRAALGGAALGRPSTLPAAAAVAAHPDFAAGGVSTHWFEDVLAPQLTASEQAPAPPDATEHDGVWISGRFHHVPTAARPAGTGRAAGPRRRVPTASAPAMGPGANGRTLTSPMRGTVTAVAVAEGDQVAAGHVVAVVEAMKMENPVRTTRQGVVRTVRVQVGDTVTAGAPLVELAASPDARDPGTDSGAPRP
jgi:acetyl-CoA/propionyl-CoA carboxylase biotin carboxyl carrier protein